MLVSQKVTLKGWLNILMPILFHHTQERIWLRQDGLLEVIPELRAFKVNRRNIFDPMIQLQETQPVFQRFLGNFFGEMVLRR